jgi:DNA-binding MarR family transcriptional regulator
METKEWSLYTMLEIFDSICILLAKAEQKHFQYTKKVLDEAGLGITPGQLVVLYTLYRGDGISITDLSKKCYLDNSTLTGLIDRLEKQDMIARLDVPGDRRSYAIHLTEKSIQCRASVLSAMETVAFHMLEGCSTEEIAIFRKVLLKIFANI